MRKKYYGEITKQINVNSDKINNSEQLEPNFESFENNKVSRKLIIKLPQQSGFCYIV